MPTLFWSAGAGEEGQQIEVFNSALGPTRFIAVPVTSGDVLPPGDFEGQLLYWDGVAWVPVPNTGAPVAAAWGLKNTNDADPCSLVLGDGTAQLIGATSQMTTRLAQVVARVTDDSGGGEGEWQMAYSDGARFTQILGTPTAITLTGTHVDGPLFLAVDAALGILGQVPPSIEITLQNTRTQYQLQSDVHVFRNPDSGGTPQNNLQLGAVADDMAVGFLGAGLQIRQQLIGNTTQEQVDAIVDALAAFGLCSDGRAIINPGAYIQILEGVDLSARVIEVIPATFPSGIYIIGFSVNCRTPQTAGTYASALTFTTPEGQASTFGWGNVQVTAAGNFSAGTTSTMPRTLAFGTGTACNLTLTPTGITGSPVYDFYTTAQFIAPIP